MERLQKLKTYIDGLDKLFYGGIQLRPSPQLDHPNEKGGLIIAIEGSRGIDKSLFAMQLMHGLTLSMMESKGSGDALHEPRFYSTFKHSDQLNDMLLDFLISKSVYSMMQGYLKMSDSGSRKYSNNYFCNYIFNTDDVMYGVDDILPLGYHNILDKYLCMNSMFYSNRTNSLHVHLPNGQENRNNLLHKRRYDTIKEYCNKEDRDNVGRIEMLKNKYDNNLFYNVIFNHHKVIKESDTHYSYSDSSVIEIGQILNDIEELNSIMPCVVLEGMTSSICSEGSRINFSHIEKVLRDKALVSILIFEEENAKITCNADIIIDMRRQTDVSLNYTYHELSISKSSFQDAAYGWHQYKKKDYGIEVYPSSHFLIQVRRYMPSLLRTTHENVFGMSYGMYIDSFLKRDSNVEDKNLGLIDKYEKFSDKENQGNLLGKLMDQYPKPKTPKEVLESIFLSKDNMGMTKENVVTALIGVPNTYKRLLSMGSVFSNPGDSLVLYMDKDEFTMQKKVICPGIIENPTGVKKNECIKCYSRIHALPMRMGCIDSDEFYYYLDAQLKASIKEDRSRIRRVVIDDLQKIDCSFPFLKRDSLFLTVLFSLCKDNEVDVCALCDKDASLAPQLRILADNLVVTSKIVKDDEVTNMLTVEKFAGYDYPSREYSYKIQDVYKLFHCENNELTIREQEDVYVNSVKTKYND